MKIEDVHVSRQELEEFKRKNFEERMDWVEYKAQWMRDQGNIEKGR